MVDTLVHSFLLLLFVSVLALVANSSALVWGPNMVYLVQPRLALARSVAYTIGRGLTLTVATAIIVWATLSTGRGTDQMASQITRLANKPHPLLDVAVGLAIVAAGYYIYRHPPAFLANRETRIGAEAERPHIWPAFVFGITILFANILEFAWQTIGIGAAVAASKGNVFVIGVAAILWTGLGTATLWGPALVHVFAPRWSEEKFTSLTERIPSIKPWEVALPLALFGVAFAVFGVWKAMRG
jgi:hypothetical protein